MGFVKVDISEIQLNPWKVVGDNWMLISSVMDEKVNTMTASWGGFGVIWATPVSTVYIRESRYTKEFVDKTGVYTLSMFGGAQKKAMGYLGKISGRTNPDKISEAGLHTVMVDGQPTFEEAEMMLVCEVIAAQELGLDSFIDKEMIMKDYATPDYHTMYIGRIIAAYKKA